MKFRFHRGSLEDSMKTVVEFNTLEELKSIIEKELGMRFIEIRFVHIGMDNRIQWDTYLVSADNMAVGHSDGQP